MTRSTDTPATESLPWLRMCLATAVICYGVVSLACGSSNEAKEADPEPKSERWEPPEEGKAGENAPTDRTATPSSNPDGSPKGTPDGGEPPASATGGDGENGPSGAEQAGRHARDGRGDDDASKSDGATKPDHVTVRFAVDDAALEMAVPMRQHSQVVDGRAVKTSAVVSGDWFIENFIYRGRTLDTTTEGGITDPMVIVLTHRQRDAEMLIWTEQLRPLDAERYLDVLADDIVTDLVSSPDLKSAIAMGGVDGEFAENLRGFALAKTRIGEREALQVDVLRTHPETQIRERQRIYLIRQRADGGPVLIAAAIRARAEDFSTVTKDIRELAAQMTLQGEPMSLAVNPQRDMGAVDSHYGIELEPLEVSATPIVDGQGISALAAAAGQHTARILAATVREVLGLTEPSSGSEADTDGGRSAAPDAASGPRSTPPAEGTESSGESTDESSEGGPPPPVRPPRGL